MHCVATCNIKKDGEIIRKLKQTATFTQGKLTGYGEVIRKLQSEVNQVLSDLVELETSERAVKNTAAEIAIKCQGDGLDAAEDSDKSEDEEESANGKKSPETSHRSPKHKLRPNSPTSPTKRAKST